MCGSAKVGMKLVTYLILEVFELKYVRKQINKIYMKLHNKNDQKDTENSRQK